MVEDEVAIADAIRYALTTDGFEATWCETGAAALQAVQAQPFDLALLDVGLPDVQGFDLFRQLQRVRDLPVVFLTARGAEIDRVAGLELGADDYLTKPFSPRELSARVRAVLRRVRKAAVLPAQGAATFQVDEERRQIRYHGQPLHLSRYEFGLLKTLLARPGRVYTREALLDLVWDGATDPLDRTVDTHVKTLRAKLLAITPGVDPIVTHRGVGYALADPP